MTEQQQQTKQWPPKTLADALKWFAGDPADNGVVVIGDDDATRVLIAFRNTEHAWRMPKKLPPGENSSLVAKWKWLTSTWRFDVESIAKATALAEETVEIKLDVLLQNRLIYPDGSIARGALTALQANAHMKLGGKPARGAARAPAAKKEETK